jgi:hypothetical protein
MVGNNYSALTYAIGNPTSTESFYDEFYDLTFDVKIYGNSEFHFHQNELNFFYIKDSNIKVYYNNISFKVGDNVSILSNLFPTSYNRKENGNMGVFFSNSSMLLDVRFNSSNVITQINLRTTN